MYHGIGFARTDLPWDMYHGIGFFIRAAARRYVFFVCLMAHFLVSGVSAIVWDWSFRIQSCLRVRGNSEWWRWILCFDVFDQGMTKCGQKLLWGYCDTISTDT
jgi:hypothetical protein